MFKGNVNIRHANKSHLIHCRSNHNVALLLCHFYNSQDSQLVFQHRQSVGKKQLSMDDEVWVNVQ